MVFCLEVIKRMNAERVSRPETSRIKVPERIALNPALARQWVNRPWTKEELGGKPSVFETYAASEKEALGQTAFSGRDGQREALRR